MAEVDLDALDKSWDDGEPDEGAGSDVDDLDSGWDDHGRPRTAAEKAVARKEKLRLRAERQRARVAAAAQKQKQKQKKPSRPREGTARASEAHVSSDTGVENAPRVPATFGWNRMLIAIAVIIAIAAFVLFVVKR